MLLDFLAGWQVGVLAGCLVGRAARWQVGCLPGWLVDRLASLLVGRLAIQYDTIQYNYIIITLRCAHPADPGFLTLNVFDSGHDASSDWSALSSNAARIWAQGLGLLGSIWASWAPFGPPELHFGLLGSI